MKKLEKLKDFAILSYGEMKNVLGGYVSEVQEPGGEGDISKIEACATFAMGDCCTFITKGVEYPGKCSSYMASEKYCSTFTRC